MKKTTEWLKKEFSSIRTGRATSAILDAVSIDSYGSKMRINQVANITNEDARTLKIVPYDKSYIKNIEKAINSANLGISLSSDSISIRISFLPLTTETKISLLKVAKTKFEEARICIKKEREKILNEIWEKGIGEDEKFVLKEDLHKRINNVNKDLEDIYKKKENEILK